MRHTAPRVAAAAAGVGASAPPPRAWTARRRRSVGACHAKPAPVTLQARGTPDSAAVQISPLVNGCWQFAGGHGAEALDGVQDKLAATASAGYTSFDTADIYGPSEAILGQFAAAWRQQSGGAGAAREASSSSTSPASSLQLLTKYVPNVARAGPPNGAAVQAAVQRSLTNLQVPQLDLIQLHWWDYSVPGMVDTARHLADLQAQGTIKQLGVTNMNVEALARILDAGVPIASNQVQFSLLDRRPLNGMLQYCQEHGIKLLTYGSVGGGLLSDKHVDPAPQKGLFGQSRYPPVDLNTASLKMGWGVVKRFGGQELWRELLQALHGVAQKHSVSVANVALRWVMQQGDGASVLPIVGLRTGSHLADNARTLSLVLDAEDAAAIDAVLAKATGPTGDCYSFERGE